MRSSSRTRLMSTRCAGRARRKLSSGSSDWPPASTFASSSVRSSAQAASTSVGAWYWNGAGFNTSLDDRDRAAQRRLAALEAPREAPERDLAVEHVVEAAAEVLDVHHVVREEQRVHDLVVVARPDLVEAAAQPFLRELGLVGADAADDGVHRVVRAAGVDGDPAHAALEDPLGESARRSRMADEVARLVERRTVRPVLGVVAVIAGVNDEDVAALDAVAGVLLPALEVLGPVQVVVADAHSLEVDHARGADQEVERKVADELAAGHEVRRRVEVSADVQGQRELLPARAVERQVLDPSDRGSRVARERGRVQRKVLRQVDESHEVVSLDFSTFPMALRGSFSSTTTRRGHL